MFESAPTSTARLTQVDGGGHTGWVKGAGPATWLPALFGGHLPSPAELLAVDRGRLRAAGLWLSGTTRVVNRLEGQGMLRRERCPGEGRGRYAVLTDLDLPVPAAAMSHFATGCADRSV